MIVSTVIERASSACFLFAVVREYERGGNAVCLGVRRRLCKRVGEGVGGGL